MTMNVCINVRLKNSNVDETEGIWLVTLRRALPERGGAVGSAQLINDPCSSFLGVVGRAKKIFYETTGEHFRNLTAEAERYNTAHHPSPYYTHPWS
jgi:hypothetical protein